jgi:tetratricopeptide (TPR) repeat protein
MMVKSLKIVLLFIGIASAQSPNELYETAQANLDAGKVSEAESGFNSALQTDPTFAPAYLGLAHTSMRKGDLQKTGSLLKEAIEIEPENKSFRDEFERLSELNTLMSKGIRSMKNGDADDAFESFRVAYEKFPNYPESVFNMGLVHFRKKEFKDAVEYFKKAMEINAEHKTATAAIKNVAKNYFNSGNQSYKRGDLERALLSYSNVLDVDETFYQAHYQVGVIQSKMGDKDAAVQSYEKALEVNPQFYKGFFALGLAKSAMNDSDGAISALEAAININPGYDKAYGAMGDIYIAASRAEIAPSESFIALFANPRAKNPL